MHKKEFLLLLKKENQFGKINKMAETKDILTKYKNIALVGASKDLKKTSSIVMKYLQNNGYKVYPVNPTIRGEKILGEKVYAKVSEIDQFEEIKVLISSYNKMIGEIENKQNQLISKSNEDEEKRLFIEAILSLLTIGVVSLDSNFNIIFFNQTTNNLF